MKKITVLATLAFIALLPLASLAHEGEDTLERLLDAGMPLEQAEIVAEHFDELDHLQEDYYSGGHSHGDGGFWSDTWALITDPAHWVFEGAVEIAFLAFSLILFDKLIHSHHRGGHFLEGDDL